MQTGAPQSRWKHLRENGLTYCEHFERSIGIAWKLLSSGVTSLVHAVIPDLFTTSASDTVAELHALLFPADPTEVKVELP
jgi:hypothetical protein